MSRVAGTMGLPLGPARPSPLLLPLVAGLLLAVRGALAGDVDLSFRTEPVAASPGRAERRLDLGVGSGQRQRRPKLITFSTDSSQIGVELGFTVPLLKVPLQGARTSAAGAAGGTGPGMPGSASPLFKQPIDVNIGALFVAGSMLLTVMGIVPAVYEAFAKPRARPPHSLQARSASGEDTDAGAFAEAPGWLREADAEAKQLLRSAEAALARQGIDAWSCGGRALCAALAGAARRVRAGGAAAAPMDLVLHGLARSSWVEEWTAGTRLQGAASGQEDTDHCVRRFAKCSLPAGVAALLGSQEETDRSEENVVTP
ncbi:Uridylate kinase [Frankliniella fusca]|uniref:Uridylate kinase n=1 Tax=Frankliniella fusca TaxID=407009 RepID=A0AAE1HKP1_9NEOP|nr:Uridylate kinase [Frankliniella fusca]